MRLFASPPRPGKPSDPPVFYTLPARCVTDQMDTNEGLTIISRRFDSSADEYVFTVVSNDGFDVREEVRAAADAPMHLAVFWDTAVDGSRLPEATDVYDRRD